MPTVRPRHQVTETDSVARALDAAGRRWPGESRSRLLVRLVEVGGSVLAEEEGATAEKRRQAVLDSAGRWTACFGPGYLRELRGDWPA